MKITSAEILLPKAPIPPTHYTVGRGELTFDLTLFRQRRRLRFGMQASLRLEIQKEEKKHWGHFFRYFFVQGIVGIVGSKNDF